MTPRTTVDAFLAAARRDPSRPFLFWEGTPVSYAALGRAASEWTDRLRRRGVGPGDRVALRLPNGPDFVAAYLGAHAAGAVVVPLNPQYRAAELDPLLSDAGARLCVVEPGDGVPAALGVAVEESAWRTPQAPGALAPLASPSPSDLALLVFTSGTTGRAKGAMHTHASALANAAAVVEAWRWTGSDRLLLTLPLFHVHGLGVGVHGTLVAGAAIDLLPRFAPGETLDALLSGRATMFFGVPTTYVRLLREAERRGVRFPRLRLWVSGSAPLSPETFRAFFERSGQEILERYGMTETGMNLTNPYDGERRPGTVGTPFPGQEARVVDPVTRAAVPDGTHGEIEVRGPHVFSGYWRRPEADAEVFGADGWFRTGDLGFRSPDGTFTIAGRARELVITGGLNVYPREVEDVLRSHPDVTDAAVVGLPDEDLGEAVAAAVAARDVPPREGLEDALAAFCRDRLAPYKKPRRIALVGELPRNAMGKVQKDVVKALLAAGGPRR